MSDAACCYWLERVEAEEFKLWERRRMQANFLESDQATTEFDLPECGCRAERRHHRIFGGGETQKGIAMSPEIVHWIEIFSPAKIRDVSWRSSLFWDVTCTMATSTHPSYDCKASDMP